MRIKGVAVIGAGVMGSGIAQVSASADYLVTIQDVGEEALKRSKSIIESSLNKLVARGKMSREQADSALARIEFTTGLEKAVHNKDLVIEAVFENLAIKHELFKKLEPLVGPDVIVASNTSALPITEVFSATGMAERSLGLHFMNPVPVMRGVEMIRGQLTSEATFETARQYVLSLGKEPIEAVDYAGFIVSRLLDVLMNEAVKMIQEGNRPEEIDKAMELCAGHPMGPCRLLDLVGAEIAMHGMETMERDLGPGYKPHPMLRKRVLAGLLGKKSGRGFYTY
ncbi:MAG: 3-hydroxyacyl-CoA dehydrogenase family protein [Syntrophobacteraceae bacterium]|nr:3-hydroxyacyl-CoA dehydrogenase family protein [Syntrophobacteraceae bacterium]